MLDRHATTILHHQAFYKMPGVSYIAGNICIFYKLLMKVHDNKDIFIIIFIKCIDKEFKTIKDTTVLFPVIDSKKQKNFIKS